MDKKELVEKIESLPSHTSITSIRPYVDKKIILGLISQLDEPEKVVIPKFVGDWIEECKAKEKSFLTAILYTPEGVNSWVGNSDNQELFALAWIFGYEVEKEPKYTVRVKGICGNHETLNREKHSNKWLFSDREENSLYGTHHTRKELEEANFGWVFDCEGVEVEEVQDDTKV